MRTCTLCQWAGLPRRDVCPRCLGMTWTETDAVTGVVRAVTHVHRAFGAELSPAHILVLVELDSGGWIVGTGDVREGTAVSLGEDRVVHPH